MRCGKSPFPLGVPGALYQQNVTLDVTLDVTLAMPIVIGALATRYFQPLHFFSFLCP